MWKATSLDAVAVTVGKPGNQVIRAGTRQHQLWAALPLALLVVAMVAFAGYFGWAALARHAAFVSNAQDLGYFDQAIWTSSRGQPLRLTVYDLNLAIPQYASFLAYHVELLLALISPLYWLWDDVRALLLLQPVVLALAAIPAYQLGRLKLGSAWAGLAIGLLVLLNPTVQAAPVNDFHTLAFAPLLLLLALLAFARRRWWTMVAWCLLASLIKEQIGLMVAMIGLATLVDGIWNRWRDGRRQAFVGLALLFGGAGWFFVCVGLIIPAMAGHGMTVSPFLKRYGQFGDSLATVVGTVLLRPDIVWHLTPRREVAQYWLALLLSGGLLPLFSPLTLLAAPELAINSLSSFVAQRASATHYSLSIVAFIVAGAADGGARLVRIVAGAGRWPLRRAVLPVVLLPALLIATLNTIDRGFVPGARKHQTYPTSVRQAEAARFFERIPRDAVLVAQDNLLPHLAHRPTIYRFAYGFTPPRVGDDPPAEWVLLDVTAAENREDGRSLEQEVYDTPGYGVVAADNGYLLLQRGLTEKRLPAEFSRFALGDTAEVTHPSLVTSADGRLRYLGARVVWEPDPWRQLAWLATVTSYWQTTAPLDRDLRLVLSDAHLAEAPKSGHSPTTIWLPTSSWPQNQVIRVVHGKLSIDEGSEYIVAALDEAEPSNPVVQAGLALNPPPASGLAGVLDRGRAWLASIRSGR